jgi:hypothetical protein
MALEGSLTDFGLADILQLIYFQRKTGILTLESKMDKVRLLFIDGNIGGAESKRRMEDNRLGKILIKKGYLEEENLSAALEEQRKTGAKLGGVLIKRKFVSREIIKEIVEGQITETIIQLFGWKHGTYEFFAQKVQQDKDLPFSLDTQHLLMEGLRIVDEWTAIQGRINLDTVLRKKISTPIGLSEVEEEIFGYIDSENDLSTIIDLSGLDNFEVSKTVLSLIDNGIIEPVETVPLIPVQAQPAGKSLFHHSGILSYAAVALAVSISAAGLFFGTRPDFRDFRESRQIDRLRVKIEAFKYEQGSYPQSLDLLTGSTDVWGRPYIYRFSESSFFLSSTGADGIEKTKDDIY